MRTRSNYFRWMDDKTRQAAEGFNAAGIDFILTELATAITFCGVALTTRHADEAARDTEQAKRALQSALRFKERVHLDTADEKLFAERASHLQELLKQLHDRQNSSDSET